MLKFLNSNSNNDDMLAPPRQGKKKKNSTNNNVDDSNTSFDECFDYSQLNFRQHYSEQKANTEAVYDYPIIGDGSFKLKLIADGSALGIRNVKFSFGYYEYTSDSPSWVSISQETIQNSGAFVFEHKIDTLKEKLELFDSAHSLDVFSTSFYFRIIVSCSSQSDYDIEIYQKETLTKLENPLRSETGKRCLNFRFLGYGEDDLQIDDGIYVSKRFLDTTIDLTLEPGSYFCVVRKNDSNIVLGEQVDFSIWCSVQLVGFFKRELELLW